MKRSTSKTGKQKKASPARRAAGDSPMDVGLLQQIVSLMSANDLSAVDLRDGDRRVVLRRGAQFVQGIPLAQAGAAALAYPQAYAPPGAGQALPVGAAPAAGAGGASAPAGEEAGLVPIRSPMVGTFYAKPSPEAKPFVSVGSRVEEDTDVCIIEAMKVFNNIKAETRGTIARILVEDRETVEFGQVLFLVKP
jgi:acetyl-CoA carboxylase biotin carboxyl carrier protein